MTEDNVLIKEILDFYAKNKENIRWKKNLSIMLNKNHIIYDDFKKRNLSFLKNPTDYQIIWHVINNDYTKKMCKNCGDVVKFNRQFFYQKTCSRLCSAIVSSQKTENERMEIIQKAKNTCVERFGFVCATKSKKVQEKIKETNLKKYGKEYPMQNKDVQEKQFKKMQETNMKRYGVKSTLSLKETREKYRDTMIKKYNVDSPFKDKKIREKAEITTKERYGSRNYTQTKDWMEKFKNHEWGNKYYEYTMPSGKIIKIQGYEKYAIDELLKSYNEKDLSLENKPLIKYNLDGKTHSYKCDIFISDERRIIEVKSKFTYDLQKNKNEAKASACINLRYKFEFWIINRKGDIEIMYR